MRPLFLLLVCSLASCAALKTGWARVTWTGGGVVPESACTAHIGAEGDVEMICAPLNAVETDLMWRREEKRAQAGET